MNKVVNHLRNSIIFQVELHYQILNLCEVTVLMELERFLVELTNILALCHFLQILLELNQFVVLSTVVWQDGDPIFKLENIRVRRIVHQDHTIQISIYYPEILCVDILMDLNAVLAVETMLYVLSFWV